MEHVLVKSFYLHHCYQLLHDGDVEEGEVVGACALHVGDDHHPLDVQLVGALLQRTSRSKTTSFHHIGCNVTTLTAVDMII